MAVLFGDIRVPSIYFLFLIGIFLCSAAVNSSSQGLPVAPPQTVGMNAARLAQIDGLVNDAIKDKKLPGAVVLVGHKGKIVYRKAFGNRSLVPTVEPMTVDTIFDVASLTKPVATATSIMILVEQGKLRLNDTIGMYIPDIDDANAKKVTIQQLLTHTSGYRPDFDLGEKWTGREGMRAALKKERLRAAPGTKFVYSDIGFIVLGEIARRIGETIPVGDPDGVAIFSYSRNFLAEVGMIDSHFVQHFEAADAKKNWARYGEVLNSYDPYGSGPVEFIPRGQKSKWVRRAGSIAPTENVKGQSSYLGSKFEGTSEIGEAILRGIVHDPTAYRMGGIAGHAGLFSTADDLARYCQMLLNGGTIDGKRIMSAQTVAKMTSPNVVGEDGATRGLGWDMNTSFSANRGELFPLGSFGHTGFTGTGLWIDRVSQTFVVFLSNRVHPDGKGDVGPLRAKVSTVVASAIEDTPIEVVRLAESTYNSAVAAQITKFKEQAEVARTAFAAVTPKSNALAEREKDTTAFGLGSVTGINLSTPPKVRFGPVLNGIDILERDKFKQLEGLKIGLVTNHTGRNLAGKQTIDILFEAKNVKLTAMFAPEHGIRGELDTEKIDDSKDEKTGLPIYSLYKDGMRRPKPEQTATIDAFVYDIQDIGARFYTYTATLRNVMEEAAKAGKPVFVLDRPNPINGLSVEGALADEDKLSFIAAHTVPVRYGLTIGELGMMMNAERKIGADLRVIKMDGWNRSMWFDETGQTWINPSPNMRSLTQATLYPGIGLLETTNVSVGRGTDTPFEVVGAPWINGRNLAKYLNERNVAGVRFVPIRFKPNASVFKDEECSGINIIITDRKTFDSVAMGIEIAAALRKLYATDWQVDRYSRLLVNQQILDAVKNGESPENIDKLVKPKKEEFNTRRASYLLYK